MKTCILFRHDHSTKEERDIAAIYFPVVSSRLDCAGYDLVIPRYSALPFNNELSHDIQRLGSRLINSTLEHQYVANFDYYEDIKDLTAQTWFEPSRVPKDSGPWVLKGRTNSRKFQWKELMYAETWDDLIRIYGALLNDPLIGPQGIVIRKFLDLEITSESIAGPPFTNEWRFFYYKGKLLSHGYYWSSAEVEGVMDSKGLVLADEVAMRVKENIPFVVIDIARTKQGEWVVIELNDGQMSGLSNNDPDKLYLNLKAAIE